jgi:hypothetical protein
VGEHIGWIVETSTDGERWRFFGKGWALPGEPILIHGAARFVRYRHPDEDAFRGPLERTGDHPMTLLRPDEREREDLWPGEEHLGLPVLLRGGEVGRLLRFEHSPDGTAWTWAVEFRGGRGA